MMTKAKILVVGVRESVAGNIEDTLEDLGCAQCVTVASGAQGVERAAQMRPDLALIELGLEGAVSGVQAAAKICGQLGVPVIYLTGEDTEEQLRAAQATHPSGYLVEPFSARQLRLNIETALAMHGGQAHHVNTDDQLDLAGVGRAGRYELMRTVFDNMDEGVIVADVTGRLLFFNAAAERVVGEWSAETLPDSWAATYGLYLTDRKSLLPAEENPLARAIQGESVDEMEVYIRNDHIPDGTYVKTSTRPLLDSETGEVIAGVAVFTDISKYKELEVQLLENIDASSKQSHLMQTVFNSVSDGVVVTSDEGEFLFVNSAAERIVGMGATDSPPDQWSETYGTYYPDRKTLFPSSDLPLARAMRGEDVSDVELFIRNPETPQGVFISVNARQLNDGSETSPVNGGVIVFRDITKLKEAETRLKHTIRELQEQTSVMQTVFDSISDGVVVADEQGNFMFFNDSAERIVGIGQTETGPDEWANRYGIFFNDRETPFPTDELPLVQAIRGESVDEVEMFIRNRNVPEGVHISVSGRPLHDDSDLVKGGVIVFRDVTERIRAEEALAEAFAHGRLEIIDTVLHNIGNAINSVSIGLGTVRNGLERSRLSARLGALADTLEGHEGDLGTYLGTDPQGRQAVPFLVALAKDLTAQEARFGSAIARVEGRVAYIADIVRTQKSLDSVSAARKDVNLRDAIDASLAMMQESLAKRAVEVAVDCGRAPAIIRIHESKFSQMMLNLVKNGVEAIDELAASGQPATKPRIEIRAYVRDDFLVLDVADNGIGLDEKNFKIVFSAGYSTKLTGSGLGLHSIANFVLSSGGEIYPLSDGTGKGTTMRVKFRLSTVDVSG